MDPKRINSTSLMTAILATLLILTAVIMPVNGQVQQNTLRVVKAVVCPQGATCPSASAFTMQVTGNNPTPSSFPGSSSGVNVNLGNGDFSVNELVPNAPEGLVLATTRSPDCSGTMSDERAFTCIITNTYLEANADADGDGLSNTWEINGIDANNDGRMDFVLPQADPFHKNLYAEVDYMRFHRPIGGGGAFGSIQDVRFAFNRAPVSNPDGTTGIRPFVLVDEEIPHANTTDLDGLITQIKPMWFGTAAERADPNSVNILAAKRMAFHYVVFAHDQPGGSSGSSGVAELPGMDSLVTLGAPGWAVDPATNHSVGTRSEQAGTFMHELGHNLSLEHGGGDATNCKPNYLSIMNYLFQFSNFVSGRPLDYSRSALATLNKETLNEPDGITQSTPPGLTTIYGPVGPRQGPGFTLAGVPVDWNFNGRSTDRGVNSDINGGLACGNSGPGQSLNGFNDWNALVYTVPQQALAAQTFQVPTEQTINDVRESRLVLLEGIDNGIQRLQSEPTTLIQNPPGAFNTTQIAQLLKTDQLDAAIAELTKLKAQVIESFGQKAANEVVAEIQNLITALEDQGPLPSAAACSHQESDTMGCPNPLEVRSGQEIDKRADLGTSGGLQ
jgi:hypothetical protein